MRCGLVSAVLAGFVANSAFGQSVNIDYHDAQGVPTSDYAAAGIAGVWNSLAGPPGIPESLLDLNGLPTSITVTQTGATSLQSVPNEDVMGNDGALLNDRLLSTYATINLDFAGLQSGLYEVYTYAFSRTPRDVTVTIDDDPSTAFDYVTGWNGALELGNTHALHLVDVTGRTLRVGIDFPGDDPVVSGIQLVLVPSPGVLPMLLLAAGLTRRSSRRRCELPSRCGLRPSS